MEVWQTKMGWIVEAGDMLVSCTIIMVRHMLGGGFKYFCFSPLFGEDFQFDSNFPDGLKPPTRMTYGTISCGNITKRLLDWIVVPHGIAIQFVQFHFLVLP